MALRVSDCAGRRLAVGDHGRRGDGAQRVADHVLGAGALLRLADDEVGDGVGDHQAGGSRSDDLDDLHDNSSSSVQCERIESFLIITSILDKSILLSEKTEYYTRSWHPNVIRGIKLSQNPRAQPALRSPLLV